VKSVLNFKLNGFSCTQNTPRTPREGNQLIFSKEEQTIASYWPFFHNTKENLENITLMFSITTISILAICSQTHFNYSLRELEE